MRFSVEVFYQCTSGASIQTLTNRQNIIGRATYSRVHISSDTAFLKILKKPSIVQEQLLPHMNLLGFFHKEKPQKNFFDQPNYQKPKN